MSESLNAEAAVDHSNTKREIVPLMLWMLEALEGFAAADISRIPARY